MKFKNKSQKHTVVKIDLYRDIVVRFYLKDQRFRQQRSSKVKQYVLVKIKLSNVIVRLTGAGFSHSCIVCLRTSRQLPHDCPPRPAARPARRPAQGRAQRARVEEGRQRRAQQSDPRPPSPHTTPPLN